MTNGEKFRTMADIEIAELIIKPELADFCKNKEWCWGRMDIMDISDEDCKRCALEWVRSEADDKRSREKRCEE